MEKVRQAHPISSLPLLWAGQKGENKLAIWGAKGHLMLLTCILLVSLRRWNRGAGRPGALGSLGSAPPAELWTAHPVPHWLKRAQPELPSSGPFWLPLSSLQVSPTRFLLGRWLNRTCIPPLAELWLGKRTWKSYIDTNLIPPPVTFQVFHIIYALFLCV